MTVSGITFIGYSLNRMDGKPNSKCVDAIKAKVPNIIATIATGHICMREENFSKIDCEHFLLTLLMVKYCCSLGAPGRVS